MREIRFRMWSEKANKYFTGPQVFECLMQQYCHDNNIKYLSYNHVADGMVFEQFTGFKDKNGVEIFEGDNFKCNDMYYSLARHESGAYELHEIGTDKMFFLYNHHEKIEVVGNIHENIEILGD